MKVGDLVKITKYGLSQLEFACELPGLVVSVPKKIVLGRDIIVYVAWPQRRKPQPINARWLETIK